MFNKRAEHGQIGGMLPWAIQIDRDSLERSPGNRPAINETAGGGRVSDLT